MRRITLLALASLAALLIACGGGDNGPTASQQPQPTERPTRAASGPTASVEPRSGPPGSEITVTGSGWPPGVSIDVTGVPTNRTPGEPYATTTTDQSGAFTVRFRLETAPDGSDLEVGRYALIVRSPAIDIGIPFLVETRRPIQNSGPGG